MKRLYAIFGLWSALAIGAHAADPTLYERLKLQQEKESLGNVEPVIALFARQLVQGAYNLSFSDKDIGNAVHNPGVFVGTCSKSKKQHVIRCQEIQASIADLVKREQRVRKLGRGLFVAAGSYEVGIAEYPGAFVGFPPAFASIAQIWSSGTDRMFTSDPFIDMSVAAYPPPFSSMESKFNDLKTALQHLREGTGATEHAERFIAAVARYRYGYKTALGEGACSDGSPDSRDELGLINARWCDVEKNLNTIWQGAVGAASTTGKEKLIVFPTWAFRDLNVIVWVNNHDAGIDWEVPLEPVLPRLVDDQAYRNCMQSVGDESMCSATFPPTLFKGGTFLPPPGAPAEGKGVCNMDIGKMGFLCRTLEQNECGVSYTPVVNSSGGTSGSGGGGTTTPVVGGIIGRIMQRFTGPGGTPEGGPPPPIDKRRVGSGMYLGLCIKPPLRAPVAFSPSGPNVCGIGGWRRATETPTVVDTPARQDDILPGKCSHCSVDLYCADTCEGGGLFTENKLPNGIIRICIPPKIGGSGSTAVMKSLIVHELVHAQQLCNQPASSFRGTLEKCCAGEYQAYLAQCIMYDRDGILADLRYDYRGEPLIVTPELCAATLSTLSCKGLGQCSDVPIPVEDFSNAVIQSVQRNSGALMLPRSCAEAVNNLDIRAKSMIASLPTACTPECRSEYENSIGNNLCFIGQCVEQSIEEERLVPGRMSQNVGDEAFPWDSCYGDDPLAKKDPPIASQLVLPSLAFPPIPEYRPWDIANLTDRALCQMLGLPPRTPPTLCQAEIVTTLGRPLSDVYDMMMAVSRAVEDQLDPAQDIQRMAPSIGARYATTLYRMQVGPVGKAYGEILSAAATLLEDIGATTFPEEMCSRVNRSCPPPSAP